MTSPREIPKSQKFNKRLLDIFGALLGLIISLPSLIIAAAVIKLDSKGPVFFRQERVGKDGRIFIIIKLRTMFDGADIQRNKIRGEFNKKELTFKDPNDPRVTKIGWFLRRWSIDELPQLWNVLRGEMSLVGPRPEEPWIVKLYSDGEHQRLKVKPGLTGPMQVSGRAELQMEERLALELEYIENYSIWKDFTYILKTIPTFISGKGAY